MQNSIPSIPNNLTQVEGQKKYFIENYKELSDEVKQACKICKINPYSAAETIIESLNSTRVEDVNKILQDLIKGNSYFGKYMEVKKIYHVIFEDIKQCVKNIEIIELVEKYFEVEKYESHVGEYIDNLLLSKKR